MKVSDLTEIWGISKLKLQEYRKKYKFWTIGLYALDVFVMCVLVAILYNSGADARFYLYSLVLICIIFTLAMSYKINSDTGVAYQFYNKIARKDCAIEYYNLNEEVLYNILYCIGYRRLKSGKSMEIYMEMLLSACCENAKCAYECMKFMGRYKSDKDDGVAVYVVQTKKKGFLGFVSESNIVHCADTTTDSKDDISVTDTSKKESTETESTT